MVKLSLVTKDQWSLWALVKGQWNSCWLRAQTTWLGWWCNHARCTTVLYGTGPSSQIMVSWLCSLSENNQINIPRPCCWAIQLFHKNILFGQTRCFQCDVMKRTALNRLLKCTHFCKLKWWIKMLLNSLNEDRVLKRDCWWPDLWLMKKLARGYRLLLGKPRLLHTGLVAVYRSRGYRNSGGIASSLMLNMKVDEVIGIRA